MNKKRMRVSRTSDPFKAFADKTRRNIIKMLWKRQVCTAGEIAGSFQYVSRPAISRHLRVLRNTGLVTAKEVGREHRYRLQPESLARLKHDWFALFPPLWDASLEKLRDLSES